MGELSYVLPLRRQTAERDGELSAYLRWLSQRTDTIVVDGSAPEVFAFHQGAFGRFVSHIPVDPDLRGRYGKVNGVVTGVRAARHERVVIADDDVRYDDAGLLRMAELLRHDDLVRPQNYFEPLPWHAAWDTARILLNRAFSSDYPGTLGVRRGVLLAAGGYDGDCLFENLEMIRTVEVMGGSVVSPLDFYVRRLPPTTRHFWSQRVRQAYDSFAMPVRLAAELAAAPMAAVVRRRRPGALVAGALLAMGTAEVGRRRADGARVFPVTCTLFAPLWLCERALCSWLAVGARVFRGGVPYGGTVLAKSANSRQEIARRLNGIAIDVDRCRPMTTGAGTPARAVTRRAPARSPG